MHSSVGKEFFATIRRNVKISYFTASIIPLTILVYFSIKYILPYVTKGSLTDLPLDIGIILVLSVFVSVLGFFLLTKATNSAISSLQNLHKRLTSLFQITKQIRETPYLDVLLESIVKNAMRLISAEAGSLLLYDDTGHLKFKVAAGPASEKIKDRVVITGVGFSGWCAANKQTVRINDASKDERYNHELDSRSGFNTKSIMCVPLILNNKVIGVLEILNKRGGIFTEEDENLLSSLADQAAISITQSRLLENQQSDMIHIAEILVAAQDSIDPTKKGHVRRVAKYAYLISKELNLPEENLKTLHYACLFHDIGFLKTGSTRDTYQLHPKSGYEIIKSVSLWRGSADIILQHHERYDGNGYPYGKLGDAILLEARILFLAEVFDVLTNKYSYREQLDFTAAVNEIEANSGLQFDPAVIKAFKASIKDTDIIGD
ncbi:MAG: GAF domain-containing protein [Nitrospirae bacterium]|nr:GAF domain-containing protein [Nitrospirota bacterium]